MQKIIFFLFLFLFVVRGFGQNGRISGTIVDSKTGETLLGATVLIEGTAKGASADFDGKFVINNVPAGSVNLIVSYVSYTTKKITNIKVLPNDVTVVNVLLDASTSQDLQEVEVVVTLNKENNTALVLQQKNNASVSDGISAETIKRTPDRNTSDVLKRISGVTIQDDKFVIIRGLNERYNASYLNGSPLPSTEPDKKAFSFDLFPANMLDNIVINKTATPDMPSEFAGGIVQINTKSIPEKNFVSFGTGVGYNTITTGKDKLIYNGGKYDNLGFNDGSRNIPSGVPSLEDKSTWITNKEQARVAKFWENDWAYQKSKFNPNASFQFASGYNFKRKDKDFIGVILSLSNFSNQNFYNFIRSEYTGLDINKPIRSDVQLETENTSKIYQTQASTGALLNLTCKLNDNNTISLKNLATGYSDNRFIYLNGVSLVDAAGRVNRTTARFVTFNRILSSQINGEDYIPSAKIKINWNLGLSNIVRSVPNLRFLVYSKNTIHDASVGDPRDTVYSADIAAGQNTGPNYSGYRVYSQLNESIKNAKVDLSRLVKINEKNKVDIKIGGLFQDRERQFNIRQFGLNPYSSGATLFDTELLYLPEDKIFANSNMSVTPDGKGGFKANELTKADDNYYAKSRLIAGFGMAEYKFTEKFRAIGGVRGESYFQELQVKYGLKDSILVKNTILDFLPSLNLVYNLNEKLGIRLAYYKTLNRPEFRELAVTNWFDPETRLSIAGNPDLLRAYIQNVDARFEIYPGRGQLFTVSGFYKYFKSPIERYLQGFSQDQIYYRNANFANVYGGELEYRVNLGAILKQDSSEFLNNLSLFSNLSLIKSEVNVKGINDKVPDTRTMQGQAPYIINAGVSYIDNKNNFSFTAMVNRVGEKIYIVGNDQVANRWENSRTVIDLQVTKSFLKNRLELRFNLKDLLHPDYVIYYKGDDRKGNAYNSKIDYVNFRRNFGSTYSFIVTYKF